MDVTAAAAPATPRAAPLLSGGRTFVSPAFDSLLIGGGLSLLVGTLAGAGVLRFTPDQFWYIILLANSAHFAASTVRLYTKPGAVKELPFLTMMFPGVAVAAVTAVILAGEPIARFFFATYLVWSPYHYAAQAYGLAAMYAYRSGCPLGTSERRLLRGTCLVPFLWTLLQPEGGLSLVLPRSLYVDFPGLTVTRVAVSGVLWALALGLPLVALFRIRSTTGHPFPLISLLIIVTNATWWTLFNYLHAFFWATVFHGVQYLAIVSIFHAKDHARGEPGGHGWLYHVATFYGACLALGYVLFELWPHAYAGTRMSLQQTTLLVTAAINLHHFVVDGYIWRLRRDRNYRHVIDAVAPGDGT